MRVWRRRIVRREVRVTQAGTGRRVVRRGGIRMHVRVRRGQQAGGEGRRGHARTPTPEHLRIVGATVRQSQADGYNALMKILPCVLALVLVGGGSVLAHEVTHKGTVVALKAAKYAQTGGGFREAQELEVTVVDPKTKKAAPRVFTITAKTRITRDGKSVTLANAAIQKDEAVAVVVDHDKPGDEAIAVQLTTRP